MRLTEGLICEPVYEEEEKLLFSENFVDAMVIGKVIEIFVI